MKEPPEFAIRAAVEAGARSPCAKSKRGAAVYSSVPYNHHLGGVVGTGNNAQPSPFACTADARCRSVCAKLCEHAEQAAIRVALAKVTADSGWGRNLGRFQILHAKVIDGQLVAGGGPSCWQCSRLVLAVGLDGVWLYETEDPKFAPWADLYRPPGVWRYYTAEDFHRETLAACGIEVPCAR